MIAVVTLARTQANFVARDSEMEALQWCFLRKNNKIRGNISSRELEVRPDGGFLQLHFDIGGNARPPSLEGGNDRLGNLFLEPAVEGVDHEGLAACVEVVGAGDDDAGAAFRPRRVVEFVRVFTEIGGLDLSRGDQ